MIRAIRHALAKGAGKEDVGDRLQPPNLLSFFNRLPRPERERLIAEAIKK